MGLEELLAGIDLSKQEVVNPHKQPIATKFILLCKALSSTTVSAHNKLLGCCTLLLQKHLPEFARVLDRHKR